MRIGLIVETLTHLALALTSTAVDRVVIFFVFGAHAFIWGTTSATVRQRAVPMPCRAGWPASTGRRLRRAGLRRRHRRLLAQLYGVTAPFWFAFVGSAVFVVLIWRQLATSRTPTRRRRRLVRDAQDVICRALWTIGTHDLPDASYRTVRETRDDGGMFHRHPFLSLVTFAYLGVVAWVTLPRSRSRPPTATSCSGSWPASSGTTSCRG